MIKAYDDIKADDLLDLKIEYNYHSHNYLCGHAVGSVSDYVKVAAYPTISPTPRLPFRI